MAKLANKKILILVEAVYEDLELWYPKIRLIEEGAPVTVAAPEKKNASRREWVSFDPATRTTELKEEVSYAYRSLRSGKS